MARLSVDGDELVVHLACWEKVAARSRNVHVPLASVEQVSIEPDWWRALRGTPARGLMVSGMLCLGTWRHQGGLDFAAVRPRGWAVVCADLHAPSSFARVAVSTAHAQQVVAAIRTAMSRAAGGTTGR